MIVTSRRTALVALLAGTVFFCGCGQALDESQPPRLVVLLAACSVNAGYLGAYGGPPGLTPTLDDFAATAAVLDQHYTESGQSGIAFASMLTGGHADHHGVFDHPWPIRDGVETLTSVFAQAGWRVAYYSGQAMAAHDLGYARGTPPEACRSHPLTADDPLFGELLDELSVDPTARTLVVTTFTTTHGKYTADPFWFGPGDRDGTTLPADLEALGLTAADVERYRSLLFEQTTPYAISADLEGTLDGWGLDGEERLRFHAVMEYLYRCAVRRLDQVVGEVVERVKAAGLESDSVVAVTSDHGEALHRSGLLFHYTHGFQLAPEVLRVPFLIRGPGVAAGRHEFVSRSVDVLPTLASLAGVRLPPEAAPAGVDLAPVLQGRAPAPELTAYSHTALIHRVLVARPEFPGSKLEQFFPVRDLALMWLRLRQGDRVAAQVRDPADGRFRLEVFDSVADPDERHNLAGEALEWRVNAAAELEAYRERLMTAWKSRQSESVLSDAEELRRLEALGYVP